jgi:hypothetical protein
MKYNSSNILGGFYLVDGFAAAGAPLAARWIRILPMNQHA